MLVFASFGYFLATFGFIWLHLTPFDYFWLFLATFGYFWLLLAIVGYCWLFLAIFWLFLATFGYFWLFWAIFGPFVLLFFDISCFLQLPIATWQLDNYVLTILQKNIYKLSKLQKLQKGQVSQYSWFYLTSYPCLTCWKLNFDFCIKYIFCSFFKSWVSIGSRFTYSSNANSAHRRATKKIL